MTVKTTTFTAADLRVIATLWSQPSLVQRFLNDPLFLVDRCNYLSMKGVTGKRWWNAIQHPSQEFAADEKAAMLAIYVRLLRNEELI